MNAFKVFALACVAMLVTVSSAALAYPTKVKLTADPNFANSDGVEVFVATTKGSHTIGYKVPAYMAFTKLRKGACVNLETDSESWVEFNKKLDQSGISAVYKTRC